MALPAPTLPDDARALDVLARLEVLIEHNLIPARGYLTLPQAALYLGASPGTLREWIRTKRLPFYKPGKELLFKRGELDAWMDRHRTVAGPLDYSTKEVAHVQR